MNVFQKGMYSKLFRDMVNPPRALLLSEFCFQMTPILRTRNEDGDAGNDA